MLDAMRELRIQRGSIETRFQQELMNGFQALTQEGGDSKSSSKEAPSLETLALVNDDELEIDMAIDNMARRTRNSCEEQLGARSEEHTSELKSLMRISSADFCLKKQKTANMKK